MDNSFVLSKSIDLSVLREGFSIPAYMHQTVYEKMGIHLSHGQKQPIKLLLNGKLYDACLVNQGFSKDKNPNHVDVLQIRYKAKGELSSALCAVFPSTFERIKTFSADIANKGKHLKLLSAETEYLSLYATPEQFTFFVDCISLDEYRQEANVLHVFNETTVESILDQRDDTAGIIETHKIVKIRKLAKDVGNNLKTLYDCRCQICGAKIGEIYGSNLIHAHHIVPFSESLNNNPENIMILCPNHHGIIHDVHPQWKKDKCFHYANGYVEGLKLNYHL